MNTLQTNNVPAAHQQKKDVKAFLESEIVQKRVIDAYGVSEMGKKAINAVLMLVAKDENLRNCSKESILQAIIDAANFGLIPNKLSGHAYLIPYKGEASLQIGYKGYVKKFDEEGWTVEVEAVTKQEIEQGYFKEVRGTTTLIEHYPMRDTIQTSENIAICYAIAKKLGREPIVAVMSIDTILEAAKTQVGWVKGQKGVKEMGLKGVWVSEDRETDFAEMCKKTVIRRLAKNCPIEVVNMMSAYEGERDTLKDVTPKTTDSDPLRAKLEARKKENNPSEDIVTLEGEDNGDLVIIPNQDLVVMTDNGLVTVKDEVFSEQQKIKVSDDEMIFKPVIKKTPKKDGNNGE